MQESDQLEYLLPKKTSLAHRLPMGDQGFVDFVGYLLQINPSICPSANEALKHPWLSFPYEPISSWWQLVSQFNQLKLLPIKVSNLPWLLTCSICSEWQFSWNLLGSRCHSLSLSSRVRSMRCEIHQFSLTMSWSVEYQVLDRKDWGTLFLLCFSSSYIFPHDVVGLMMHALFYTRDRIAGWKAIWRQSASIESGQNGWSPQFTPRVGRSKQLGVGTIVVSVQLKWKSNTTRFSAT